MRDLIFRLIFLLTRALRPSDRHSLAGRGLNPLDAGSTVLYLQFEKPLGCCIHGTPLIEALKAVVPDLRLIVATRGPGAATLRHHPGVDQIIETEGDPLGSSGSLWSTAAELRDKLAALGVQPDVILQDASSRRGTWALFAALLRLAPTIGFADAPVLYDQHLAYDANRSLIDNNLRLPVALGGLECHREPQVFFAPADLRRAEALLLPLTGERAGRIGFVLQGSGGQRTGWYDERFAEVVRTLEAQGYETLFLGTAVDVPGIDRVRSLAHSAGISLAGETSVPEAAAVLCLCDLLITVDTGTMHLGRAVGVPMVVLGPSWQRPLEWLPLELGNTRILRGPDRDTVPAEYHLDEIAVSDVLAGAADLLQSFPSSASARDARVKARLSDARI